MLQKCYKSLVGWMSEISGLKSKRSSYLTLKYILSVKISFISNTEIFTVLINLTEGELKKIRHGEREKKARM